jgi:hypothetical protein
MDCGADAMVQQVLDEILADRDLLLHRLVLVHDTDGLGFAQTEQRLGHRAGRFAAAVSRNHDMIEGWRRGHAFRNEKKMPPGSEQDVIDTLLGLLCRAIGPHRHENIGGACFAGRDVAIISMNVSDRRSSTGFCNFANRCRSSASSSLPKTRALSMSRTNP